MPLTDEVPVRRRQGLQEESSRQRRAQILDAAEAAFLDRGFSAASLRDVAARAGISHTGLLHHYPDKNALLEALLDDRLSGLSAVLPFDARDGASFLHSLVALADRDAGAPEKLRLVTMLTAEGQNPEHPAHGYFLRWHKQVRDALTAALTNLAQDGKLRPGYTPAEAATHLWTMREGAHTLWLLDPTAFDLPDVVRSQMGVFVDLKPPRTDLSTW